MRKQRYRSRPVNSRVFCENKKSGYYIKTALYIAMVFLLISSIIFVTDAGEKNVQKPNDKITYKTIDSLLDASGEEVPPEIHVINGVDIKEIDFINVQDSGISFDVVSNAQGNDASKIAIGAKEPQILIYHTHTQEAYLPIEGEEYIEVGEWRTTQQEQSVVAVGEVLMRELEAYGFTVLHDTTNHEPPRLSTSYSRSLLTIEEYAAAYPTISIFIDVHRDSYDNIESGQRDFVTVGGEECARVMFIVGAETINNANHEANLALASAVTNELESIKKGFTRPLRVQKRQHNYNQHVSDMCLLIEVGHNANSLEQAKNTAKYVALALSRVLSPQTS